MSFTLLTPQTGFLLDVQARNLSPHTLRFYRQQISWFAAYLVNHDCHQLDQITPHHIRAYLLYLQGEKEWKSASVHAAARAIRAFFTFMVAMYEERNWRHLHAQQ